MSKANLPSQISASLPAFMQEAPAMGNENVTADDLRIPMLKVLQALSPEIQEDSAKFIEGSKPGMIANTVTNEAFASVLCMNLYYKKDYIIWLKRTLGGGKIGEFKSAEEANQYLIDAGLDVNSHDIVESGTHYVLLLNDKGDKIVGQAVIPMSGTNMQVSDGWNSNIAMLNVPQRFAPIWELSTAKRKNAKGSWSVFDVKFLGYQANQEVFEEAVTMYKSIAESENSAVA